MKRIALTILVAAIGALATIAALRAINLRRASARAAALAERARLAIETRRPGGALRACAESLAGEAEYLDWMCQQGFLHDKRDVLLIEREARLRRLAADLDALAAGRDELPKRRGEFLRAYRSPVDGALQPYAIWVPFDYDPVRPAPLLVHLHGLAWFVPYQGIPMNAELHRPGLIVVSPHARGSLDYTGLQENEVLATIEDVRRRYSIDPDRIYAGGFSMGGTGSWRLACRHPELFAAISPWSGNTDPAVWDDVFRPSKGPPATPSRRLVYDLALQEMPIHGAETLARIPVWTGHGSDDDIIPPGHSRNMVEAIRAACARSGAPERVRYTEAPGCDHRNVPHMRKERVDWLMRARRSAEERANSVPAPPRVKCLGPAGRAFEEPFAIVVPEKGPRATLFVLHEEVEAFARRWKSRFGVRPPIQTDRQALAGAPLPNCPNVPRHLILLGGPRLNAATRALIEDRDRFKGRYGKLPAGFSLDDEALEIAGVKADDPDCTAMACIPGRGDFPFAVVVSSATPAGYFLCLRRFGYFYELFGLNGRIWFDCALFDPKTLDSPDTFLVAGFLEPESAAPGDDAARLAAIVRGDERKRKGVAGLHYPAGLLDGDGARSGNVADWFPSRIDMDRAMGFGRTPSGRSLNPGGVACAGGLCVRTPSEVCYEGLLDRSPAVLEGVVGMDLDGESKVLPAREEMERVVFEVWADDACVWRSPEMGPTAPGLRFTASVPQCAALTLKTVPQTVRLWFYGDAAWGDLKWTEK